jgi:hypothetical protein
MMIVARAMVFAPSPSGEGSGYPSKYYFDGSPRGEGSKKFFLKQPLTLSLSRRERGLETHDLHGRRRLAGARL